MRTWCQWSARQLPKLRGRVRVPSSAPCDRSVSGKHVTLPWLQGRFESGRSLSSRTSPTAEAPGLGPGGSRFESEVRYSRKVNRSGRRARPLSEARFAPCRSSRPPSAIEDEPARAPAAVGSRMGAGRHWVGISVLGYLPAASHRRPGDLIVESEPARACGRRLESGWARKRRGSSPSLSAPGRRAAGRHRALKACTG